MFDSSPATANDAAWTIPESADTSAGGTGNPYALLPVGRFSPGRSELEKFVAAAFQQKHGARVQSFMPNLLGLRSRTGELRGVTGYRMAAWEPLYLEQYLDKPVEVALSGHLGAPVTRDQITEIGNFASSNCRMARYLAALLPGYFLARGQAWAVFTATGMIREILAGLGAPLLELCGADGTRLAGTGDDWGRYYETDPRVMAVHIPSALGITVNRRRRPSGCQH